MVITIEFYTEKSAIDISYTKGFQVKMTRFNDELQKGNLEEEKPFKRVPQVQIEINFVANVSTKIKSSIRISHETEAQRQSRKLNYIEINWTNANRNTHPHNTRIEILKYQ